MMELAENNGFKNIKKEISFLNDFTNFALNTKFRRNDVFFYLRKNLL